MSSFSRSVISGWLGWRNPTRTSTWPRKWWHSIIARQKSWWARGTTPPRWTCGASAASSASSYVGGSSSRPKVPCNRWVERIPKIRLASFLGKGLTSRVVLGVRSRLCETSHSYREFFGSRKELLRNWTMKKKMRFLSCPQLELITELLGSPSLEEMRYACEGAKSHMMRRAHKPPSLATLYNLSSQATHEAVHLLCQMLVFDPVSSSHVKIDFVFSLL